MNNINWYPGHMKKTRELIESNLKLVDLVIEVIDARVPVSSRNPLIDQLVAGKKRIIVLNKSDLADPGANEEWERAFSKADGLALQMNCMQGEGLARLFRLLDRLQQEKDSQRALKKPLRMMIVGVPNVGKSSLINRMTGRKSAKTGDKPGVTRGKQWLALKNGMQLLDTPGILWPKFEDPRTGLALAFCGSIRDEIMDASELALALIGVLQRTYPALLMNRYKLETLSETPLENMEAIAQKRGFILGGGRIDYERCARTLLDEFRSGRIGRITLERAEDMSAEDKGAVEGEEK